MSEKKSEQRFTLKKLVQRLHIHEPAQLVQALLGCRWENTHSIWVTPWLFNTRSPSPYSLSRPGLNWDFLALTDSLFLSELLSDAFEMMFSLVCSRYPSNLQAFSRSHLPGPWDSSRAGKRMKLARPETWERELSSRGNKATVWEELIGRVTLTTTLPSCLPHSCLYILAPEIEVSMAWCSYFHLVFPSLEMTGFNRSAIDHIKVASGLCFE